ncbi:MAG: precorrin-3B C(17)-methyltransferase [Archaeoglobus sp.]|uniref:precorrin-3B C(17)-methyltransferase n=1 Tax=Archaeoglobus sp. TaxID=1872626 RepID=UPI001D62B9FE|nr:precorrin-3B C(17)-methyltransferase [Archaeoglobus sp.]MBO8179278.1 precorrin-3B C(17)-methyltransferase [Archaeoglobus sp.]
MQSQGKLYVVGIGPGNVELMTLKARKAIEESEYVVGYKTYVERISDLLEGKKVVTTPMRKEVERVEIALNLAREHVVSLISGGDPSVYGILPLVVEYVVENNLDVAIEVVPGVTAVNAASALLGSPISGDHAVVSLSDLLVPWSQIEKRLIYALKGDFVVAIYNPSSRRRRENLRKVLKLIRKFRGDVWVGVVRNAFRDGERVAIKRVSELEEDEVDMNTILIVGNSESVAARGFMFTPRGYSRKYKISPERKRAKMGAETREGVEIARKSEEILKALHTEEGLKGDIVRRCIATTGDVSIRDVLRFKGDVYEGVKALKDDCRIIVDVRMVKAGLRRDSIAAVDFGDGENTKTASGLRNLEDLVEGSIVAIGNSPSAALALYEIAQSHRPRFIVATPVGFVNAAESKEAIRSLEIPSITTEGPRGGSGICAAIVNCLIEHAERSD